jgi:hypothetical protein
VKALPGGTEPDMILVSCAGGGLSADEAERVVPAKRAAEALLRNSGLGYTILRPGALEEAPGGARALLFDQGGRITEGIACADVADVCVRSLHDEEARNTSFDVCHEYSDAAGSRYELVAHLPTAKTESYLTPALKGLEKSACRHACPQPCHAPLPPEPPLCRVVHRVTYAFLPFRRYVKASLSEMWMISFCGFGPARGCGPPVARPHHAALIAVRSSRHQAILRRNT